MSSATNERPENNRFQCIFTCQALSITFTLIFTYAYFERGNRDWLITPLISLISIFILCALVKIALKLWHWINEKPNEKEWCRRNWIIGSLGICICGYIPQIVLLFVDLSSSDILPQFIVICNLAPIFFIIFFLSTYRKFEIKEPEKTNHRVYIFLANVVYIGLVQCIVWLFTNYSWDFAIRIGMLSFGYMIAFFDSTGNLWTIYRYGVRSKSSQVQQLPFFAIHQKPVQKSFNFTEAQCNVCILNYSAQVIPRVLQCGHTICEECSWMLMKNQIIPCPFCRRLTFVPKGLATELPKNFALLGLIQEKKM